MFFNPFYEMERMKILMDKMWDSFLKGEYEKETMDYTNIYESKDGYMLQFLAPGVDINDVNVNFSNGLLTVEVKREVQKSKEEKEMKLLRNERMSYNFKRSYRIPDNSDIEKIEAKIINGLLMIYIPKKEEAKPKKINIKVS